MEVTAPPPDRLVELADVDLYAPDIYPSSCQHAAWRTLRLQAPMWWHGRDGGVGFWCVTRHADCERVVKNHRLFSSAEGTILASVGVGDSAGGQTITLMDPPEHTAIRAPAMRAVGHAVVRERAPAMREQIARLVRPCEDGEQDFARLARRLPMVIAGELMGVPERLWDDIAVWTTACIAPEDPAYALGATPTETLRRAHHELFACFSELVRSRRAKPGKDLVSALIALRLDGQPMDDWRVMLNCYSFILGANTTTAHVASHTLLALIDRPESWAAVADDPALVPHLVEEGVRWTSPTHHLVRRATADTEIAETPVAAGDWVCAWVASANRDETVFQDPYTFDVRRTPNPHLGFGQGAHYCIGAPSARLALAMLFEELVRRFESFERAGDLVHLRSNWINGLVSMPVVAKPRR